MFKCLNGLVPLLSPDSADHLQLMVPETKSKICGNCAFCVVAPRLWNQLPLEIRQPQNLPVFNSLLKTNHFSLAFNTVWDLYHILNWTLFCTLTMFFLIVNVLCLCTALWPTVKFLLSFINCWHGTVCLTLLWYQMSISRFIPLKKQFLISSCSKIRECFRRGGYECSAGGNKGLLRHGLGNQKEKYIW